MEIVALAEKDTRSVIELVSAAIDWTKGDGEGDWAAVTALHSIGSVEVLRAALDLAKSDDPRERARSADILGQLGVPERTFPEDCLNAVLQLVKADSDYRVIEAAAVALGHLRDVRGSGALVALIYHPDHRVRHAAVFALGGRSDSVAVEALIRLTTHNDAIVRDWATFGLGAKGKLDTPEIREALHRRLNDDDPIIRYEAICGLVRCGDLRAIDPLIAALSEDPAEGALWIPACSLLKTEYYELTATDLVSMLQSLRESANLEKR